MTGIPEDKRGKIVNVARATQVIDFSGCVLNGTATPSDMDGIMEIRNHLFIIIELKHTSAQKMSMGTGQGGALRCFADLAAASGKWGFLFIAEHNTEIGDEIIAAECKVIGGRANLRDIEARGATLRACLDHAYNSAFQYGTPLKPPRPEIRA